MSYPLAWWGLGAVLVIVAAIHLRRKRDEYIAELRAKGDPAADAPMDKTFRRDFQNWLIGQIRITGFRQIGNVLVFAGAVALLALGLYSLIGGTA